MSALVQTAGLNTHLAARLSRPLKEVEAMRIASQSAGEAAHEEAAIRQVAEVALRVIGIFAIRFEPQSELRHLPLVEAANYGRLPQCAAAVATVTANGTDWGKLRIFFHIESAQVESPVRFARFLAQQIALTLGRLKMLRQLDRQALQLAALNRRVRVHKLVHRAVTLLARQRSCAHADALAKLIRYARSNRKTLLDVAESVIIGDAPVFKRPSLYRVERSKS